jgi:hypothetical protein
MALATCSTGSGLNLVAMRLVRLYAVRGCLMLLRLPGDASLLCRGKPSTADMSRCSIPLACDGKGSQTGQLRAVSALWVDGFSQSEHPSWKARDSCGAFVGSGDAEQHCRVRRTPSAVEFDRSDKDPFARLVSTAHSGPDGKFQRETGCHAHAPPLDLTSSSILDSCGLTIENCESKEQQYAVPGDDRAVHSES